jgi:oligopeptide transport system substrate-binding protein
MLRKSHLIILSGALFLAACGGDKSSDSKDDKKGKTEESSVKLPTAKGDVAYGGVFVYTEDEKIQTLFPATVEDIGSAHVVSQMYESLLKLVQKDLSIAGSVATEWTVNDEMTEFTFTLKKGVKFHDNECFKGGKGRELVASDVKFSYELLCTKGISDNVFQNSFKDRLLGATEFYNGEAESISGIEIVDDYTVKLKTVKPSSSFLYIVANPTTSIIPKEAYEKYGLKSTVGTGAFIYNMKKSDKTKIVLDRNPNYHVTDKLGNQLPYLAGVEIRIVEEDITSLDQFMNGDLSMIYGLPSEKVSEIVQSNYTDFSSKPPKFILLNQSEMVTQYYELNLTRKQFQDVRVRKALAMAVDRTKLYEDVLKEQAAGNGPRQNRTGNYGLVPPIYQFNKYDTSMTRGYTYNPEMAQKLMAQAGYPNGKGFPTINLELNYGGSVNSRVANAVANMWTRTLGVNVELNQVSREQKMEDAKYGKADIFRSAWVADFPSPETFLSLAYGKNVPASLEEPSHPNSMRYKNPKFDELYEKGIAAKSEEERLKYFAQAERIMLDDCPVIILWYAMNYRLIKSEVHNFYNNSMDYFDLSDIYMKEYTAEEVKKKADETKPE